VQKTVISPNDFTTLGLARVIGLDGGQQHLRMLTANAGECSSPADRVHGDSFSIA
jgi:hypothetical protein